MQRQQFDMARENFEESLQYRLQAKIKTPNNSRFIADIANARSWLASAALAQGDVSNAIAVHLELQQDLASSGTTLEPYLLDVLASSYQILADLFFYQGKLSVAQEHAGLGYKSISKALEQDSDNSIWQKAKYYYYYQSFRFSVVSSLEQVQQRVVMLDDMLKTEKAVLSDDNMKDIKARQLLTAALRLQSLGQFRLSKEYSDEASRTYRELASKQQQNIRYLASLSASQLVQAKALIADNKEKDALVLCREVDERLADIVKNNKDPQYTLPYLQASDCLGQLENHQELLTMLDQHSIVDVHFHRNHKEI